MTVSRKTSALTQASALDGTELMEVSQLVGGAYKSRQTTLARALSEAVDVRKFGVSLSSNDNAVAWAAAVASGEVLLLPAGTIKASAFTTRSGLIVFGKGWDSILKLSDASNNPVLEFSAKDDWYLSDFAVDGNKANQTNGQSTARGINITGSCSRWKLHHIKVSNALDTGIRTNALASGVDAEIRSCYVTGCGSSAHTSAGGTGGNGFDVTGDGILVQASQAFSNQLSGFKSVGGIVYNECVARSNNRGFENPASGTAQTESVYHACRSIANTLEGFYMAGAGDVLVINACTANGNGASGVTVLDGVVDAVITGNLIRDNGKTATRSTSQGIDGITILATGTVPSHILVDQNVVIDNTNHASAAQYGIYVDDGASDVVIGRQNIVHGNKTGSVFASASCEATIAGFEGHPSRVKQTTDTSLTGSTSPTDLKSVTLPANTLRLGQTIEFDVHGTITGTNGTKTTTLSVAGSTATISSQLAAEAQNWGARGTITAMPGNVLEVIGFAYENGGTSAAFYFQASQDLANTLNIKVTGQLGSAADTITQKLLKLDLKF